MNPAIPSEGVDSDPITRLCAQVQTLARQTGEDRLQTRRAEAEKLIADARQQVQAECASELAQVRNQLQQQRERALQNARMEARARLAQFRWRELDAILDEAEAQISQLRQTDPARYTAALGRLLHQARQQLGGPELIVRASAENLDLLRGMAESHAGAPRIEWQAGEVPAGFVATTAQNTVVLDQSLQARRQRLDEQLRLAAAAVLFEEAGVHE